MTRNCATRNCATRNCATRNCAHSQTNPIYIIYIHRFQISTNFDFNFVSNNSQHGGLSPELEKFEDIANIARPCDVPDTGLLCDILWADPDPSITGWGENDRGVSFTFGGDVVRRFLRHHDLDLVVRAHQVVEDGYEFFAGRELVTIFSAPNYCGEFDNAGAMMTVDDTLMCSFQILKPASAQSRSSYQRPGTPGRR